MPGHAHAAGPGLSREVHGAYIALWNDLELGNALDGYTMRYSTFGFDIQSDIAGESLLDSIYTGMQLSVTTTLQHWNAGAIEPMIWWHGDRDPSAYEFGLTDAIGRSMWDAARPLILYSCHATGFDATDVDGNTTITPSTGASAANPYIDPLDIVFMKAILRKDEQVEIALNHRPRYLTLTLDVLPISNSFGGSAFDPTAPDSVERVSGCEKIRYFAATRGTAPT